MKKLILALAVLAGALAAPLPAIVAPGFAQAPPPVPAEPDTERRTRYSGVSSVTTFPVGFDIYGDGTDYQNWIEVWVNGINVPAGNWSLVPTSGSFTTLARPLLAANLNVVFTSGQSGTIDIVGARRPRRTSQLANNAGVTARDFNQVITDLWMTLRETWDRTNDLTGRVIIGTPGEVFGPLPPPASRAGQFLCFNAITGAPTTCVATTGSTTFTAGSGITLTGTSPTTISTVIGANTQVGDYSIAPSDCQNTVVETGSLKTVTLAAAAGFSDGCEVTVKNGNATRGQKMVGFPSDVKAILWPLKSVRVKKVSGAWTTTSNPGRWIIPSTTEVCVRQDGSATSDGLGNGTVAADCLPTGQAAVTLIGQQWDGSGYSACNIGYYAGGTNSFSESVSMTGQSVGCYLTFYWRGATTHISTAACFTGGDNGIAIFNMNLGFVPILQCNTANAADSGAFYGHQTVIYDWFGSLQWVPGGSNDNFIFMDAQGRGVTSFTGGGLVIGDGAVRTFNAVAACGAHCAGVQLSGTIGCSPNASGTNILRAKGGSWMNISVTFSGCGAAFVSVGAAASGNSVIKTNGITFPATTQSTNPTGGQICTTDC